MEIVSVNFNITTDCQFAWSNELHIFVHVLILSSFEEWSLDNTWVLLSWFENGDGVVCQIERDDEPSINIFWYLGIESCCVSEDFLVIVYIFEEINLWFLCNKFIHISQWVYFITKSIVRWNLNNNWISWFWLLDITKWEMSSMFLLVVILSKFIHTLNNKHSSISNKRLFKVDFIAC